MQELIQKAKSLLESGEITRVLGWKKGENDWDVEPAYFETVDSLQNFVYNGFCGANLSKYMIEASKLEGRTLVFLKPCDSYSFVQLLKEHRIDRKKAYIIGVGCAGQLDPHKLGTDVLDVTVRPLPPALVRGVAEGRGEQLVHPELPQSPPCGGDSPLLKVGAEELLVHGLYGDRVIAWGDALLERCHVCKGKEHKIYDELLGGSTDTCDADRFAEVERIEAMSPEEKFAFFQAELSKCIRCNACRNVCPACSCRKCVFDSTKFDSAQKANTTDFEEKMFHIIRAFHVAGRCTDCGECSRVCPQGIPLHLFNRKFIKDINSLYGEYQAGSDLDAKAPLTSFRTDDAEPGVGRG